MLRYVSNKWQRLFECLLVAAVSAFTGFITLFLVDDCQPVGVNPNITEVNQVRYLFYAASSFVESKHSSDVVQERRVLGCGETILPESRGEREGAFS